MINEVKKFISPVYLCGGAVRDQLLGTEPKDFDFTTPLTPEEIEKRIKLSGRKAYLIGKRFGTLGCKINGYYVEISTFRSEIYETRNRKPNFTFIKDIKEDLSRRDFTINALARDENNNLIDYFNGSEDLIYKIIRSVGKPSERFQEDPLRLLRSCRFAAQLGFNIEENTLDMAKQLSYKILEVSKERWMIELDKLLMSNYVKEGLKYLQKTKLLNYILPELSLQVGFDQQNPHHSKLLWDHTIEVVSNTPPDISLRWSSLLHDIAKPFVKSQKTENHYNYHKHDLLGKEFVLKYSLYLKWSNERRDTVLKLVETHMNENSPLKEADQKGK